MTKKLIIHHRHVKSASSFLVRTRILFGRKGLENIIVNEFEGDREMGPSADEWGRRQSTLCWIVHLPGVSSVCGTSAKSAVGYSLAAHIEEVSHSLSCPFCWTFFVDLCQSLFVNISAIKCDFST